MHRRCNEMVSGSTRVMRGLRRRLVWIRHGLNDAADLVLNRSSRISNRVHSVRSNSGSGRVDLRPVPADAATELVTAELGSDKTENPEARLSIVVRVHAD